MHTDKVRAVSILDHVAVAYYTALFWNLWPLLSAGGETLPLIGMAQSLYCSWCVLHLANFYSMYLFIGKFAAAISGGRRLIARTYLSAVFIRTGARRCRHNFRYRANKSRRRAGPKENCSGSHTHREEENEYCNVRPYPTAHYVDMQLLLGLLVQRPVPGGVRRQNLR